MLSIFIKCLVKMLFHKCIIYFQEYGYKEIYQIAFNLQLYSQSKIKMWSQRRPTSRSLCTSYSNNFQLLKNKCMDTRPNPQQVYSYSLKSSPRYDFRPSTPKKFRVNNKMNRYKAKRQKDGKSQTGRTVYQIYNVKGTKSHQKQQYDKSVNRSYNKLSNKNSGNQSQNTNSQYISHISNTNSPLNKEKQLQNPNELVPFNPSTPMRVLYNSQSHLALNQKQSVKNKINFEQRKWDMHESAKAVECHLGCINAQQFHRQNPLSPSKPQKYEKLYPIKQQNLQLSQIPSEQPEDSSLKDIKLILNPQKLVKQYSSNKELIDKLNSRTRYLRFRHNERMNRPLNDTIYGSKERSSSQIQTYAIKYGQSIESIMKILYNQIDKIKITIKIPTFFMSIPDTYLSQQQLRFKGLMYFEQCGIIVSPNPEREKITMVKHPQSFMYQYQQFSNEGKSDEPIKYCINWYSDNSVYLGGIRQDTRWGIGLEWVPGMYVYYGQYEDNYRHGYGVIKYNSGKTYIGVWAYDQYHGYGKVISQEGSVIKCGSFRNSEFMGSEIFNQLS